MRLDAEYLFAAWGIRVLERLAAAAMNGVEAISPVGAS
jgi:hypothetical protein